MSETLRVLIVEDSPGDVDLIRESLSETGPVSFQIEAVSRLSEALARLKNEGIDLVLLDLGLPDSNGLKTFRTLLKAATHIPVIILTADDTQEMAISAVREGAQDYIIKGELGSTLLIRSVRYAVERKRAEKALFTSSKLLQEVTDNSPALIYTLDTAGRFLLMNRKFEALFGVPSAALIGKTRESFMPPEIAAKHRANDQQVIADKQPISFEEENEEPDGKHKYLSIKFPLFNQEGGLSGICGISTDITERKRAEEALQQSYDMITKLTAQVPGVVYQYRLYPDGRSSFPFSSPGMKSFYEVTPEDVREDATPVFGHLHPDDHDRIVASIQESGRTLQPFHCEFRVVLPRQGLRWRLSDALPERMEDGGTLWYGIISDITDRKQAEEKLQDTLENLRKAVNTTIQVMVSAIEVRDPYTAGHQIRSAGLASAIATDMGLSQEKIEGIRVAGSIHDIGKLSLPADILSKPKKLSEIEFSLIKEHSEKGYDILKNVESPWPLAEIVYQHHERMDGSGYPRKLKGNDILIEARILNVADVVEAMASHRPYRPSLGIDAALNEIEKNRGIFYDEAVVAACLRLFREKGFTLEETPL